MQPYLPNLLSFIFVSDFWPFSQGFLWMTSILINPKCTALHLGLSGIYWKTRAENPKKKKGKENKKKLKILLNCEEFNMLIPCARVHCKEPRKPKLVGRQWSEKHTWAPQDHGPWCISLICWLISMKISNPHHKMVCSVPLERYSL